jgi:hypothetical protein
MVATKNQLEKAPTDGPSRLEKGILFGSGVLHAFFPAPDDDGSEIRIETCTRGDETKVCVIVPNEGEYTVGIVVKRKQEDKISYNDTVCVIVDGRPYC